MCVNRVLCPMAFLVFLLVVAAPGCTDLPEDDDSSSPPQVSPVAETPTPIPGTPAQATPTPAASIPTTAPSPTPEPPATPTTTPLATPTASPTATPPPDPVVTPTPNPELTPTLEPALTPTPEPVITPTSMPRTTPTPEPPTTPTPLPIATPTPLPSPTPTPVLDVDGDGYPVPDDCDDTDPAIHPDALEVCDGVDNDCDNTIDEDVLTTYYADSDGDGYGDPSSTTSACDQPEGYADRPGDCDDDAPLIFPGAEEICDGQDNDCNDLVDDGLTFVDYYRDADGDGYGTGDPVSACVPLEGYATMSGDCDDSSLDVNPDASEVCNDADDNCDGDVDEGLTTPYYQDADGDGFGNPDVVLEACDRPDGYVSDDQDCDDDQPDINPGGVESCDDGVDQDCDGTDLSCDDVDNDGDGLTENEGDCDDNDATTYPGAVELCNGIDNDCDGTADVPSPADGDLYFQDADGDGYGTPDVWMIACSLPAGYVAVAGDCDDETPNVNPDATDFCNDRDDDCDGDVDEGASFSGAIAQWHADGDATDSIDGHDGTIQGAQFVPGMAAGAFSFGGDGDTIAFDDAIGNFGTSDFTIDFWINTTASRIEGILGKRPSCSHGNFIDIRINSGRPIFEIDQDGSATNYVIFSGPTPVNDGSWHHVALVRQGISCAIYVDGALDAVKDGAGVTDISNSATFAMGRSTCTGADGTSYFTGALDEVEVFDRALSDEEIFQIFSLGGMPKCVTGG